MIPRRSDETARRDAPLDEIAAILAALGGAGAIAVERTCAADALLDKMLVYGPGQFFLHQQRSSDMVATLVVVLPSTHRGCAVVVEHRAVIGAGSVVTRDIPDGVLAVGNPCRVIRAL